MRTVAHMGSTYRMADRLAGGNLADLIRGYRAEGLSWDSIGRRLFEHGIEVSGPTIQGWAEKLGVETPEAVA